MVNFIGHGDPAIARAMAEQASQLEFAHSSNFTTEVAEQFARELLDFAGPAFRDGAVFFTSGGSESVESALKLARQYQVESGHSERYQVVSRRQSYHGATLGAMAVSGNRGAARDLPAHDAGVSQGQHSLLLPLSVRLRQGMRRLRPEVRRGSRAGHRRDERHGGGVHHGAGQRSHAGSGCTFAVAM